MTVGRIVSLLAVVLLMSAGQILFKLAAGRIGTPALSVEAVWRLVMNPYLIMGGIVYLITTLLWVLVLVDGELSRSYPVLAATMVLVPLFGILFFNETFSIELLLGGALIFAGIAIIAHQ